jgi:aspartate 1-decarboxylase
MLRTMLKSKIHRARVTGACIDYEGSITIDLDLMRAANMLEYEQVHIYNVSNGERFITYVIPGQAGSGDMCLNGAAARKVSVNDIIIICTYAQMDDSECQGHKSTNVYVDTGNRIARMG